MDQPDKDRARPKATKSLSMTLAALTISLSAPGSLPIRRSGSSLVRFMTLSTTLRMMAAFDVLDNESLQIQEEEIAGLRQKEHKSHLVVANR